VGWVVERRGKRDGGGQVADKHHQPTFPFLQLTYNILIHDERLFGLYELDVTRGEAMHQIWQALPVTLFTPLSTVPALLLFCNQICYGQMAQWSVQITGTRAVKMSASSTQLWQQDNRQQPQPQTQTGKCDWANACKQGCANANEGGRMNTNKSGGMGAGE